MPQQARKAEFAATLEQLDLGGKGFAVPIREGKFKGILYSPEGEDRQTPHTQNEFYVIVSGRGNLRVGRERLSFGPGDLLYVPSTLPHRFEVALETKLVAWAAFFAPDISGDWCVSPGSGLLTAHLSRPAPLGQVLGMRWMSEDDLVYEGHGLGTPNGLVCYRQPGKLAGGVLSYALRGGGLDVVWTHSSLGGLLGTGAAQRLDENEDPHGFVGRWSITYRLPNGDPHEALQLVIHTLEGSSVKLEWSHEGMLRYVGYGLIQDDELLAAWSSIDAWDGLEAVIYELSGEGCLIQGQSVTQRGVRSENLYRLPT